MFHTANITEENFVDLWIYGLCVNRLKVHVVCLQLLLGLVLNLDLIRLVRLTGQQAPGFFWSPKHGTAGALPPRTYFPHILFY